MTSTTFLLTALLAALLCDTANTTKTIHRDVCIIGGGSSGTYTAIQLQRQNHSVALIEQLDHLGGNVATYKDPISGQTLDIGVIVFEDLPVVIDYFKYLDVPLGTKLGYINATTDFVNLDTGAPVNPAKLYSGNVTTAIEKYSELLAQKYGYLTNGYNLPDPVPEELLITWGQFLKKHDLEAMAYTIWTYNQGVGNILDIPTLYMLKYLDLGEVAGFSQGLMTTKHQDNQQLYDKAATKLGSDVLLQSTIESVNRTSDGVTVTVQDAAHNETVIVKAKRLVVAIRPLLSALQPWFDLSPTEQHLLGHFNTSYYYCGLVKNSGLPKNLSLANADDKRPYGIPASPGLYGIGATGLPPDLHTVYFTSPSLIPDDEIESRILAELAEARKGLGLAASAGKDAEVFFWHAHVPFFLTVSAAAIRGGFYRRLQALQGEQSTFWTGAAWQTEDSSAIWNFTQAEILPRLLHELKE